MSRRDLTPAEADFMHHLREHHYLPVARFLLKSTTEDDFTSVALAPVYLRSPDETMEPVRQTGAMLLALEEAGFLTLDYDIPLKGYAYEEYHGSDLYAFFCKTVDEGKGRPGFLGDTPCLETGSIAPCA